jgi:hypothetical protein
MRYLRDMSDNKVLVRYLERKWRYLALPKKGTEMESEK